MAAEGMHSLGTWEGAAEGTLGNFFVIVGPKAFGGKLGVARTWPEGVVGRRVGGKEGVRKWRVDCSLGSKSQGSPGGAL